MSRILGVVGFFLGLALFVGAGIWFLQPEPEADEGGGRPPYVLPVTLATVVDEEVVPRVPLTGSVRSRRRATLAFTARGTVAEVLADTAERVEEGAVLARLLDRDQTLALDQARADALLAKRNHEMLLAGTRAEEVRRLEAELEAARADAELADLEVERARTLTEEKILSRSEEDRLVARARALRARVQATNEQLELARAGTRQEDLAIAEARVAAAEVAVATAQWNLEKTRLLAPFDGAVLRRLVSPGDHVDEGEGAFDLVDLSHLEIEVEIPSRYASLLGEKAPVVLHLDDDPEFELRAVLDAKVPGAEEATRNFRGLVRLAEDSAGGRLLPGMFVRVDIALAPIRGAAVVPDDAVRVTEAGFVVVAAATEGESTVARWVPVNVLGSADGRSAVEPLEGELAPGERVVVTGVDLAWPGAPLLPRGGAGA